MSKQTEKIIKAMVGEMMLNFYTTGTHYDDEKEGCEKILRSFIEKIITQEAPELPEITEVWAAGKAKEIWQLIKDAQDEDLSDPAMSLHYLGLSLDIIDSIISDLRPKNK